MTDIDIKELERENDARLDAMPLDELARRLNGEYRIPITDGLGPAGGDEPDNPNEHVRHHPVPPIQRAAARRLLSLSGKVERMRGALAPFAAIAIHFDKEFASTPLKDFYVVGVELKRCRNARAALGKDTPNDK